MSSVESELASLFGFLVCVCGASFFVLLFFIAAATLGSRKRKAAQAAIITALNERGISGTPYIVRYASEKRFQSWFKMFPWEGTGILIVKDGKVHFYRSETDTDPVTFASTATMLWIGISPLKNSSPSWFAIDDLDKWYFTSDSGVTVFGSRKQTRAIFDQVGQALATIM